MIDNTHRPQRQKPSFEPPPIRTGPPPPDHTTEEVAPPDREGG
jgi:hypothetical protein